MDSRDALIAKVGDIWIGSYTGNLVSILKTEERHITYIKMRPDGRENSIRKRFKSDFYTLFRKVNEDDLNEKAEYDYKKFISQAR